MHALPCNSTDHDFSETPPIFPSRPCLTVKNRSQSPQRKAHISELADSFAWFRSLRPFLRVIVVILPLMSAIVASMLVEPTACAQTASPSPSIDRFAKFIVDASVRFAVPVHWIRAVIRAEASSMRSLLAARWG
jgi:hypothetical protein